MNRSNWTYFPVEKVQIGYDAAESVRRAVTQRHRSRAFILTSRSLATSKTVRSIGTLLGERHIGSFDGLRAHVPLTGVLAAANAARAANADALVAVGGGSVMDAAKLVSMFLRMEIDGPAAFDRFEGFGDRLSGTMYPEDAQEWVRIHAVPTTLSAAEFTWWAAPLDPERRRRRFVHPYLAPQHVALDPQATLETPRELFLSTGMKAVDHAVERLAAPGLDLLTELHATRGLEMLGRGLRSVAARPDDLNARLDCLTGTALTMSSPAAGARVGSSHALGHALGALLDVPHGLTTGVLLPSVLRWSRRPDGSGQEHIAQALGDPHAHAADLVADLVSALGLPGRLRDVGVTREDFGRLATRALSDPVVVGSPRMPDSVDDLVEILEMAW